MQESLGREPFVWAKGSLCVHNRIPFDAELLLRRFPPPYNLASLQQAALVYDSKIVIQRLPVRDTHSAVYPVLAILKPKMQENTGAEPSLETPNHSISSFDNGVPLERSNVLRNREQEPDGNVIDGRAGNDFIAAGTGADYVHTAASNDNSWRQSA